MRPGIQDRGLIGRADLLQALREAAASDADRALVARALGYQTDVRDGPSNDQLDDERVSSPLPEQRVEIASESPRRPVPFLVADGFERTGQAEVPDGPGPPVAGYAGHWRGRPARVPIAPPLASWRDLRPVITQLVRDVGAGRQLDVDRAIAQAARAEIVERIPRKEIRRWPVELTVIVDRSRALAPFWGDQRRVLQALKAFAHDSEVRTLVWFPGEQAFADLDDASERRVAPEDLAGPVLVLGDLGAHDPARAELGTIWGQLGGHLGPGRALALSPGPRPTRRLEGDWTIRPWGAGLSGPERGREALERDAARLVMLLSPAVRIEPGLMRMVRLKCLPHAEPAIESLAWQSKAFLHGSSVAARFRPEHAIRLRRRFREEDRTVRRTVLETIRAWRAGAHETVWYEEVMNLDAESARLLPPTDVEDAKGFFAARAAGRSEDIDIDTRLWLAEAQARADLALDDRDFRMAVHKAAGQGGEREEAEVGLVSIWQDGADLTAVSGPGGQGSLLGHLWSVNGRLAVEPVLPDWASDTGRDVHGRWIEFEWRDVVQRLRWIPAGSFDMGSPETEEGRWADEGPQTRITFAEGFWIFDTAVSQALWEAVMDSNPSAAKGEELPVTNISWRDASAFIDRLNTGLPGIDLRLPSEAEWEYACRAGSTMATAFGEVPDKEQINFEADGTIDVKAKLPNAWGLYQMHGNVDEWCQDAHHDNHEGADPEGRARQAPRQEENETRRVVRGGSWHDGARNVRAAYRNWNDPEPRLGGLGFRCARGQAGDGPGRSGQTGSAGAGAAEPRPGSARGREEHRVRRGASPVRLASAEAPYVLRTDLDRLELRRIVRDDCPWADVLIRDRFGLRADVKSGKVRTCLRWIPPGRFRMGSPQEEAGRFDYEGPLTDITFAEGFWLMDAPVTQTLWTAVMEKNPSRFRDPDRPVEGVSWHDVQAFISRLNERGPGLELRLPSEAEWEYACRAGTEMATYAGAMKLEGARNAPILDAIAWYGGNSGVDFDLEGGHDSSDWTEKQYPHERTGTRKVRLKEANAFGCHDMLGNVWEWCADAWAESHEGADPGGAPRQASRQEKESGRVIRGGSWDVGARFVRAAYRGWVGPGGRGGGLGFRCARGQASSGRPVPEAPENGDAGRPAEPDKTASRGLFDRIFGSRQRS